MRVLAFAACAVVLFASDEASAACNKGLLWPYVRNPGDCLTDEEVKTGKIGIYNGPVNAAPDVSSIKVEQPAQSQAVSNPGAPASEGILSGLFSGLLSGGTPSSASSVTGGTGTFSCNKGYFWPFYRSPGDCLTDIEKKNGQKGVYGGGPGNTPLDAGTSTVTTAPPTAAAAAIDTNGTTSCRKGLLWPFLRDSSDCPTGAEKKNGEKSAGSASVITPANDNAGAANCHKGLLWPFAARDCYGPSCVAPVIARRLTIKRSAGVFMMPRLSRQALLARAWKQPCRRRQRVAARQRHPAVHRRAERAATRDCCGRSCIAPVIARRMMRKRDRTETSRVFQSASIFSAAMKASCGMSTLPNWRIFFLPSFCLSRSLRLRVMSPP